jgi:uncharacterized membrane protein
MKLLYDTIAYVTLACLVLLFWPVVLVIVACMLGYIFCPPYGKRRAD